MVDEMDNDWLDDAIPTSPQAKRTDGFAPSAEQSEALRRVSQFYNDRSRQYFVLAGYAGTGKTTLAKSLPHLLNCNVLYAAYTGKAVSVLKAKGMDAYTLHSLLFRPKDNDEKRRELEMQIQATQDAVARRKLIERMNHDTNDVEFMPATNVIQNPDLLVVDEYSMVDEFLLERINAKFRKVLFIGDPMQLPPVKGGENACPLDADFTLQHVHRQAGALLRVATRIRDGELMHGVEVDDGQNKFTWLDSDQKDRIAAAFIEADVALCFKNENRRQLNRRYRARLNYSSVFPQNGEQLVCLRNSYQHQLWNGEVFKCHSDARTLDEHTLSLAVAPEKFAEVDMRKFQPHLFRPSLMIDEARAQRNNMSMAVYRARMSRSPPLELDFGYALTVHKSQGSEWNRVVILHDYSRGRGAEYIRWLYTAVTRARISATVVEIGR